MQSHFIQLSFLFYVHPLSRSHAFLYSQLLYLFCTLSVWTLEIIPLQLPWPLPFCWILPKGGICWRCTYEKGWSRCLYLLCSCHPRLTAFFFAHRPCWLSLLHRISSLPLLALSLLLASSHCYFLAVYLFLHGVLLPHLCVLPLWNSFHLSILRTVSFLLEL